MKTSSSFHVLLCLTMIVLTGCSQESSIPTETPEPAIEITSFPNKLNIHDIDVEFSGYELNNQNLKINICFSPTSEENWYFDDITLKVENQEFTNEVVSSNTEPGRADGFQCGTISYSLNDSAARVGRAELSIGRAGVFASVDKQNCDDIQKNLDRLADGFVITCDPAIVGRDSGFVMLEKPKSMSEEDALLFAMHVSSYSDIIPLNWRFTFMLEKP